jgi:hypothetical protein
MPITCTCTFAVKASTCVREHRFRTTTCPLESKPTKWNTFFPKSMPAPEVSWNASCPALYNFESSAADHPINWLRRPVSCPSDAAAFTSLHLAVSRYAKDCCRNPHRVIASLAHR